MTYCKICGEEDCDKHSFFIGKTRKITSFTGSSPPEIFVGRWNYPNVYTGILSPEEYGDTEFLSSPEVWHSRRLGIQDILRNRNKLIYGRTQSFIKKPANRFISLMQEVAMTCKSIATEFILKKPVRRNDEQPSNVPLIAHAAEISSVRLQENASVKPKVDYLVNDTSARAVESIVELDSAGIQTSSISKLLSAGLLGRKSNRKLVPTRWSITAVDDSLSKKKLLTIRHFSEINDIKVFHAEYLGNHYEFLLLPEKWSFEVIEITIKNFGVWHDHEGFFDRKKYADDVTGAYYANRLAVTEYLEKFKKQASCIVFREVRPEYSASLGVGILRETSREAFAKPSLNFSTLKDALVSIQERLHLHIDNFINKSNILNEYGKQQKLTDFFK